MTGRGAVALRLFSRSASTATPSPVAPIAPPNAPSRGKVFARISNTPKFMFKSDLLWFLKGSNLTPADVTFMYDAKYRPRFIQVKLDSVDSFRLAQRSLAMKGRFGGRYLKLIPEEDSPDNVNFLPQHFRGRSLLMGKIPPSTVTEDVERFFTGYRLDSSFSIKFLRSSVQAPSGADKSAAAATAAAGKPEFEVRALVRFRTELEALRALREKQGAFCLERPIDLRYIE